MARVREREGEGETGEREGEKGREGERDGRRRLIIITTSVNVLEVNLLCGLSEHEETSLAGIMRIAGKNVKQFVGHVLSVGLLKYM